MERFCSADLPYWNLTQIWDSTQPDFPLCFQETSLVWVPCLFLLLILPYHLFRAFHRKRTVISSKLAARMQRQSSRSGSFLRDDADSVCQLSRQSSAIPTPRNSLTSNISADDKTILRSISEATAAAAKERGSTAANCCVDSFPLRQFKSSILTGLKQSVTLLLIILCFIELLYGLFTDFTDPNFIETNHYWQQFNATGGFSTENGPPIFEMVTPGIKFFIFILVLALQYLHWRHRIVSSVSLFIFWVLFSLKAILSIRSFLWNYFDWFDEPVVSKYTHYKDAFYLSIKLIINCLVLIEFVFSMIPEPQLTSFLVEDNDEEVRNEDCEEALSHQAQSSSSGGSKLPEMKSLSPCPLLTASVLSRLTFWWVSPMIWNTFRRPPLSFSQIWALEPANWSIVASAKFSRFFLVKRRETKSKPSSKKRIYFKTTRLMWSIVRTFWPQILFNALLKLTTSFLPYLSALFLSWLINFMEKKKETGTIQEPIWHGALYVTLMLVTPMLETLLHVQYNFGTNIVLLKIKASLCNAIYRKGLRLSSVGREQFTTGEVINLMAIDTQRVGDFFLFLNDTWSVPLQILFAVYLLWDQLGYASLAGLVLMVLLMPLNSYLVSHLRSLSQYVMEYKDKRLKLMHDILAGIKVLKLYAWEDSFEKQVTQRRDHELCKLKRRLYYNAAVVFIFNSAPFFVTVSSFATYIFIDANNRLEPEKAFVSLALFNQLRNPFAMLPRVFAFYAMFSVSLRRLNRYFRGDELFQPTDGSLVKLRNDTTTPYDIKIENGTFTWANTHNGPLKSILKKKLSYQRQQQLRRQLKTILEESENKEKPETANNNPKDKGTVKPTLEDINLQAKKGQLVAVVGEVGSGKSSLISALLGDMFKLSGVVKINRSIAYVAQQAWIQNATVRDNILFMSKYDEAKYQAVLDACALQPDLNILPGGDQTEIGEKGINLSGGQKQRISLARACYTAASLYLFDDPLSSLDAHVSRHIFDAVIGPKGMLRKATRLLVTHRISVLAKCDYIYVLKNGKVAESGTYSQLTSGKQEGNFAELLRSYLSAQHEGETKEDNLTDETLSVTSFDYAKNADDEGGSEEGDFSTQRRRILVQGDLDETELYINSCFKEIDELSLGEEDTDFRHSFTFKPKAKRVVSFLEAHTPSETRSRVSSLASSVPSTISKASLRSQSSRKAIFPKELHTAHQIQPEARQSLHQTSTVEQAATGSVKMSCYWNYFKRVGLLACAVILLSQTANLACNLAAAQWLAKWSEESLASLREFNATDAEASERNYHQNLANLGVYIAFGLGECIFTLLTTLIMSFSTLRAAKLLHADMLSRLLRAPMSFFDMNPIGRVLNRFSRDCDIVDIILNMNFRIALFTAARTIAAIVIIAIDTPFVLLAVLPLGLLYFVLQKMYLPTSRQLRRIESTTRSPIYSHFGESLNGSSTIRAFGKQTQFIIETNRRIDQNNVASYAINGCTQWIITRLEFLGHMVVFANALYCLLRRDYIQASITGLTLTYSMTITRNLNHFIMVTTELENSVVSFERCLEYCKLNTEADYRKPDAIEPVEGEKANSPQSTIEWPSKGEIEFSNYSTRYRPDLDLVLKSVTFRIAPGERVGIVGRTGAGKSSLTMALFRIIERVSGTILIDGRDIADLGLFTLRSRLTIIPQDPVLFTGTLRMNLDPFHRHTDEELWTTLELTNLRPFVSSLEAGLQHSITEGGDNLSVGQRQLICLSRAMLRKSRILVLDEATGAVDIETDAIIQQTIRKHFVGCTIFTIAHRIETIFDYNRILVLHNGQVLENDSPERLLAREDSVFRSLAHETGLV